MKKLFLLILALPVMLMACIKNDACKDQDPSVESSAMQAFCLAHGIFPTTDQSGIMYEVMNPGNGATVTNEFDTVVVKFEGKLMNGTTFAKTDSAVTLARTFITGLQVAIQKISEEGRIQVVIPSYLAFGCTGNSTSAIPSNSPVYYDLTVKDVKKYQ